MIEANNSHDPLESSDTTALNLSNDTSVSNDHDTVNKKNKKIKQFQNFLRNNKQTVVEVNTVLLSVVILSIAISVYMRVIHNKNSLESHALFCVISSLIYLLMYSIIRASIGLITSAILKSKLNSINNNASKNVIELTSIEDELDSESDSKEKLIIQKIKKRSEVIGATIASIVCCAIMATLCFVYTLIKDSDSVESKAVYSFISALLYFAMGVIGVQVADMVVKKILISAESIDKESTNNIKNTLIKKRISDISKIILFSTIAFVLYCTYVVCVVALLKSENLITIKAILTLISISTSLVIYRMMKLIVRELCNSIIGDTLLNDDIVDSQKQSMPFTQKIRCFLQKNNKKFSAAISIILCTVTASALCLAYNFIPDKNIEKAKLLFTIATVFVAIAIKSIIKQIATISANAIAGPETNNHEDMLINSCKAQSSMREMLVGNRKNINLGIKVTLHCIALAAACVVYVCAHGDKNQFQTQTLFFIISMSISVVVGTILECCSKGITNKIVGEDADSNKSNYDINVSDVDKETGKKPIIDEKSKLPHAEALENERNNAAKDPHSKPLSV